MSTDAINDLGVIVTTSDGRRWRCKKIGSGYLVDTRCVCALGEHRHSLGLLRVGRGALPGAILAARASLREETG